MIPDLVGQHGADLQKDVLFTAELSSCPPKQARSLPQPCAAMRLQLDVYSGGVLAAIASGLALAAWRARLLQRRFPVPPPHKSAVLVTGVSGGLGEAFAKDLAKQGYLVIGTVRKQLDADALNAARIVRPVLLDVANPEQFPAAVIEVRNILEKEGRSLCALVNNAGVTGMDKTRTLGTEIVGPEHYDRVMATNVMGLVRAGEAFLPLLKQTPGARIVNIGSYFGDFAPGVGYTVASKFAVEGLTDVWRRALRGADVLPRRQGRDPRPPRWARVLLAQCAARPPARPVAVSSARPGRSSRAPVRLHRRRRAISRHSESLTHMEIYMSQREHVRRALCVQCCPGAPARARPKS